MPRKDNSIPHGVILKSPKGKKKRVWWVSLLLACLGLFFASVASVSMVVALALAVAFPNLPDISSLSDYRPKLPLRIFTADGILMGEFGEERREMMPITEIPKAMTQAVLAIEDARFFEHGGVDYVGILRAAVANLGRAKSQGASTITMQVARNVYLSSEKTYTRKIYEMLLTYKLEHLLSKNQILEIYMNQIYLGSRSYGFASAAQTYFGVSLKNISIAQAAMLAGLPKAPSAYNPISNFKRARSRQLHVIDRMVINGFITQAQAKKAKTEVLKIKSITKQAQVHAEYVTETVRQLMFSQYGDETYTRGLNVFTSLQSKAQNAAYVALRSGIMNYESRQFYRGPEKFVTLPKDPKQLDEMITETLEEHPDNGEVIAAIVLTANSNLIKAVRQNGEVIVIRGSGLKPGESGLSRSAQANIRIRPGAVIRAMKKIDDSWEITQLPEVEGAFVAMDPRTGGIKALVGGFDFNKNKFNHVTQAWRQPGSCFKPFVYSAALEKGFSPATIVNDGPLFFDSGVTGGQPWEPKNYEGKFEGPMTIRNGLAKSKNMISIRILQAIGPAYAQNWVSKFGFDANKHPPYLTMALGSGSVTPIQMVAAYSIFANGGYRINPWLISKVTDQQGNVLTDVPKQRLDESVRVIDARNAFIMNSMLQEVTKTGTAASAQVKLKRSDIYGKTGTTNEAMDAWFSGFHPTLAAVTWIGYDSPKKLGDRESGGGLSLPVWIDFMQAALHSTPFLELPPPKGLISKNNEWYYDEYTPDSSVRTLGLGEKPDMARNVIILPPEEEKRRILDLFKN